MPGSTGVPMERRRTVSKVVAAEHVVRGARMWKAWYSEHAAKGVAQWTCNQWSTSNNDHVSLDFLNRAGRSIKKTNQLALWNFLLHHTLQITNTSHIDSKTEIFYKQQRTYLQLKKTWFQATKITKFRNHCTFWLIAGLRGCLSCNELFLHLWFMV